MVSRKFSAMIFVFLAYTGMAMSEPLLTVKADKRSSILGEPLVVEIKADDMPEPLSSLNLDTLKLDFNVYSISSSQQTFKKSGRTVKSETMTLILYPLHSGKLHLPVLKFHGKSSKELVITIADVGKHSSRVIFKTTLDTDQLNVRQAATLTLDIYDEGRMHWSAPGDITAKGAHLRKLAGKQFEEMLEGVRYTVHRYAWALTPLREGTFSVEFPMLDAMKFGSRMRYAVAPFNIDVAPVPAYLPVYVPIGKMSVVAEALPDEIALQRPVNRTFSVQGTGISIEGLTKLLSAVQDNESVHFYPSNVRNSGDAYPATAMQTLQVTIPFVPLHTGKLHLPELNIPYYDTEDARMKSTLVPAVRVDVFNPLWHTVWMLALPLLLLSATAGSGYWIYRQFQRRLNRRKSLLAISRSKNTSELKRALLSFDIECKQAGCPTLQQWLIFMQQRYTFDDRLTETIDKLERIQYGESSTEVAELAHEAAQILSKLEDRKGKRFNELDRSLFHTLFRYA